MDAVPLYFTLYYLYGQRNAHELQGSPHTGQFWYKVDQLLTQKYSNFPPFT